jgi:hypothetical protein
MAGKVYKVRILGALTVLVPRNLHDGEINIDVECGAKGMNCEFVADGEA